MKSHSLQPSHQASGVHAPTEWIALDGASDEGREWLRTQSGLDRSSMRLLQDAMPRSRCVHGDAGILVTLVRPDESNDDALQDLDVWLEPERVITISRGAESAVEEVADRVDDGYQRGDALSLLAALTVGLVRPLENIIIELVEEVDDLEDEALDARAAERLDEVSHVRRRTLAIRRRLNAIHDVVSTLAVNPGHLYRELDVDSLRRGADYMAHLVGIVDGVRDRLILLFDQLSAREQHRINKAMQKLAVVGTVFLPLTFVTGLLGINVAGIPDAHDPMAFWLVCLFLVVVVAVALWIIKLKRWI